MKKTKLVSSFIILIVGSFAGCYPFYSGIYSNDERPFFYYQPETEVQNEVIIYCPERQDIPEQSHEQVGTSNNQKVKYREVQPLRTPETRKEERKSNNTPGSRDNDGYRNEITRRR